jgi:chorismate dehydratase
MRIGAVSYLNSKPLVEGLPELLPDAELLLDYPSRLADDLAAGLIDVGLIPSIECFRGPGYRIVSDACVAARGPVLSVKLYSRVPVAKIRRLSLDEGSRTSAALVRILLAERFAVRPDCEPLPMGETIDATDADAVLLIGDRAIHPPDEEFAVTWDLGEEWTRWTGLPFVFAVWAARDSVNVSAIETAFATARDRGLERLRGIARRESIPLGIDEQTAYHYLSRSLHFRLGPEERAGLNRFRQLAAKCQLIDAVNCVCDETIPGHA